jgi:predicted enzyme related to lactoylglutathione lyase
MKNAFLGLRTTIYRVSDITKAKAWYSEVLGFPPYFDEVFYVGFNVGGFELGLQPIEGTEIPGETVITYWGVEDAHAAFQRLRGLGAVSHEEPTEVGGGIVVATVKDPWGNLLGVIYNPHFK